MEPGERKRQETRKINTESSEGLLAEMPLNSHLQVFDSFQVTASGSRFQLRYLEDRIQILSEDITGSQDILEQILEYLDLDSEWLTWINPAIKLVAHEVWRQDDNGQALIIRTARCRADASRMIRRLESSPHKQIYWMRLALPGER